MAWRGASGNGVAFMWELENIDRKSSSNESNSGPIVFLGGLLLLITSILEFIIGNTFPCVVFGTIGESSYTMREASITRSCCWLFSKVGFGLRLQLPWFLPSMQLVSPPNQIYYSIQGKLSVCSRFVAPYSSSTTDTAAGLASEGFLNTYGNWN